MKKRLWPFLFLIPLVFQACDVINPSEPVPSYIYVPGLSLNTGPGEGSNSQRITEVWLEVDGLDLGAYAPPILIPVLEEGPVEVTFNSGIRVNGISTSPAIYPFFAPVNFPVDLQPNQVDTLRPVFTYLPEAQFAFIEDFESGTPIFGDIQIGSPENAMRRIEDEVFEGQFSGVIELDTANFFVQLGTTVTFSNLTRVSNQVALELNYKTDVPIVFGVGGFSTAPGVPDIQFEPGVLPRESWNKIYLSLGGLIQDGQYPSVQIILQAFIDDLSQVGDDGKARVYLDNIKLVHF